MHPFIVVSETFLIKSCNVGRKLLNLNSEQQKIIHTSKVNHQIVLYKIYFHSLLQIYCKISTVL
jgi:hypothetical protein